MPPARCQPVSVAPRLCEKTSQPPSPSEVRRLRQQWTNRPRFFHRTMESPLLAGSCFSRSHRDRRGCQRRRLVANRSPWLRASVRKQASRRRQAKYADYGMQKGSFFRFVPARLSPNHGESLACRQLFLTEPQRSQRVPMPPARCQPVSVAPRLCEKTSQPPSPSEVRRLRQRCAICEPLMRAHGR